MSAMTTRSSVMRPVMVHRTIMPRPMMGRCMMNSWPRRRRSMMNMRSVRRRSHVSPEKRRRRDNREVIVWIPVSQHRYSNNFARNRINYYRGIVPVVILDSCGQTIERISRRDIVRVSTVRCHRQKHCHCHRHRQKKRHKLSIHNILLMFMVL